MRRARPRLASRRPVACVHGGPDVTAIVKTSTEPSPKRRRMPAAARRAHIIAAARRVFVRAGFAGARTRDVAVEAGVNEALIYQHFSSKAELFESAVTEPLQEAVAQLVAMSSRPPEQFDVTGEEMFRRTSEFLRDLLIVMKDIAPLLGIVLGGDAEVASGYYRERLAPALEAVSGVVAAHAEAWSHRDFDPDLVVKLAFGMTWFLALTDQFSDTVRDPDELAGQIARLMIFGLETVDGTG